MAILSKQVLSEISESYGKRYGIVPRMVTREGAVVTGDGVSAGPIDRLLIVRQARAHALKEGVRWGEAQAFFLAPGIINWLVPLVKGYSVKGGVIGGEVITDADAMDRVEGIRYLTGAGASYEQAADYKGLSRPFSVSLQIIGGLLGAL